MSRLRLLIFACISLALGALTTLGFAWIPAALATNTKATAMLGPYWEATEISHEAQTPDALHVQRAVKNRFFREVLLSARTPDQSLPVERRPAWTRHPTDLEPDDPMLDDPGSIETSNIGAGFPFVSFTASWIAPTTMSAWPTYDDARLVSIAGTNYAIPIGAYWPGLLANTAIWTGAWLGPFLVIRAAWRRTRRGKCPECGYSRDGLADGPCPECGTAPKPKHALATDS